MSDVVFLEDAIRICLAESCFEEIDQIRSKNQESEKQFKDLLDGDGYQARAMSEIGQTIQERNHMSEKLSSGEVIPPSFWVKIIEMVKPEIERISKTADSPETEILIGQNLGEIKMRSFQRNRNLGGRPSNVRLFINGTLMTKTDFARKYDPSYADAPETSRRMSWEQAKRLCVELFQQGKIYVALLERKNGQGDWVVQEVIGG